MNLEHIVWLIGSFALGLLCIVIGVIGLFRGEPTWPISAMILAFGMVSLTIGVLIRKP